MKYFMTQGNVYYEADEPKNGGDFEVIQRPSNNHNWDYDLKEWVYVEPVEVNFD
jgi:hypothetical protein